VRPIRSPFVPNAISLANASVTDAAVSTREKVPCGTPPIIVSTPPDQWAYAAIFQRTQTPSDPPSEPLVVQILTQVTAGAIGLGCLNTSETAFIDEEVVGPAEAPVAIELVVPHRDVVGPLIVRNSSPDGPSEARILEISCFALDPVSDDVREPALSDPRPTPRWERYYGTGGTLVEKLRVQAFGALQAPTVMRWIDDTRVRIIPGDQLSLALFVSSTYEPNTLCVLRRLLHGGGVFFDVGANAGIVSLAASRWVGPQGRVYSFEPSEREYARLLDNIELNAISNVTPIRAALSSQAGRVLLRVASSAHAGLNTLGERFAYDGIESVGEETVESMTLDEFVKSEGIARVSVIKLDVEGSEGAALAGGQRVLQEHRPALVFELSERALAANNWTLPQLERLLQAAAYKPFLIEEQTARLRPVAALTDIDPQNVVALPEERQLGS